MCNLYRTNFDYLIVYYWFTVINSFSLICIHKQMMKQCQHFVITPWKLFDEIKCVYYNITDVEWMMHQYSNERSLSLSTASCTTDERPQTSDRCTPSQESQYISWSLPTCDFTWDETYELVHSVLKLCTIQLTFERELKLIDRFTN